MFSKILSCVVVGMSAWVLSAHIVCAAEPQSQKSEQSRQQMQQKLDAAQKRLDAAAREVAELSQSLSEDMMPNMMRLQGFPHRAVLGINLRPDRGTTRDDGVEVLSVSPGGPAERAGIKGGDVLTKIDGQALTPSADHSPRDKLLQRMEEVDPGQDVNLEYRRAGKVATARVKAQPLRNVLVGPGTEMPVPPLPPNAPGFHFFTHRMSPFGDLEMVSLTPKLGKYFGTDQGLLVVRVPQDSKLQIEDGDVILDIDGRKPSSPSHAMRILSSYQGGERIKLGVLRDHKRLNVEAAAPEAAPEVGDDVTFERAGPGAPPLHVQPGLEGASFQFAPAQPVIALRPPEEIST
jgi:S1-C subfamily serine protease